MAVLLELVLKATYFNQEIINRFNYLGTGTPGEDNAAPALAQAFGTIWDGTEYPTGLPFRDILNLQTDTVVYDFCAVRDVYSDIDFIEVPFVHPATGLAGSGQGEAPYVAFGLRTNRVRLDVGRGYKRFVGVGEGWIDPGGVLGATGQTALNVVAEALTANLTQTLGDNDFTFVPVIVSKMRYTPPNPVFDPAGTAYRYWPTYAAQSAHWAAAPTWEIYTNTRSQTSRQYGKGR